MANINIFDASYYVGNTSNIIVRNNAQRVLNNLKLAMNNELEKSNSFTDRLVIITDTLENISNLLHGRCLVSYEEFRKGRRLIAKALVKSIKQKGQKKVKKYKKWKK